MTGDTQRTGKSDLHLCNNYRHLLIALASISSQGRPAVVVYLEDDLPLPADARRRLAEACPFAEFIFSRDADQTKAFARLPRALPAIVRRNLTVGGRFGLCRPRSWQPPLLKGRRFATGYLYHSGFFFSKVVAGLCQTVVLRESGLNYYVVMRVPLPKAILRFGNGLPPLRQTWGEERWIDALEVSCPQDLPEAVRDKARRLTFADVMDTLPEDTAHRISAAFLGDFHQAPHQPKSALLLTQPLSEIGICSVLEQHRIYRAIATKLETAGYAVYVKPHPRDLEARQIGVQTLPATFPVEAWPYFSDQKFHLAVALCSASLTSGARDFAERSLQLLSPEAFNACSFHLWPQLIERAMQDIID